MQNIDTKAIKERLAKHKPVVSPQQRVKDNLLNWFLNEQPPADDVSIVAGTLKTSPRNAAYWEATVQTVVFMPQTGAKIHNSRVFFFVDSRYSIIQKKVNFKTV